MSLRLGCALLAAGGSRRLGRPKQLVTIQGVPMVRRAALAALGVASASCSVVLGAESSQVSSALSGLPLTPLHNANWETGMASSIRLAADWAQAEDFDGLLLTVCDQPRLDATHLERLTTRFTSKNITVASFYSGARAVPAVFPARLFAALSQLAGDVGIGRLLQRQTAIAVVPWPDGALDIDTPEQLTCVGAV
jgi:CTP:molybdopterin cytidylyltransferase MocA